MKKLSNKFIIVIPLYNVKNLIIECLDSIFNQSYSDLGVIIRDDVSNDETTEIIKNYFSIDSDILNFKFKNKDVIFIKNKNKLYPVGNIYDSVINYVNNLDSIIGVVDGDDYLIDSDAVSKIEKIYKEKDLWMVWAQHKKNDGQPGESKKLPNDNIIYQSRQYWSVSHFRTSLSFLFHKLNSNDLLDPFVPNSYFTYCGDAAYLFPFCEMCGNEKSYFLDEILYHYNNTLPSNEHNKNLSNAIKYGNYIRSHQKKYKKI
jgi:glycosyltransferase involved in cell wall biosynthesis